MPFKFSKLFIIEAEDETKIPDISFSDIFKLHSTAASLSLGGCNKSLFNDIIENDRKFREWRTEGKRYVMVCFVNGVDKNGNNGKNAMIFELDSILSVQKMYSMKDKEQIFERINNN